MSMGNTGFVPMKRTKERQPNKQTLPEVKGKKWQRNNNKRSYEDG